MTDHGLIGGVMLQLSSPSSPAVAAVAASTRAAVADRERRFPMAASGGERRQNVVVVHDNTRNYRRPGIPHSNICTLCNKYVYLFRHRCLVCGRVYCRRCVGSGMGDMTEGLRKCIDCLGRRYSHRAGDTTSAFCLCFWGYYPSAKAVTAQELVWAEKGPAPRRRPPRHGSSSVSTCYDYFNSTNTIASTSMSCDNSMANKMNNGNSMPPASASSSFVASSYAPNPHAFPV